MSLATASSRSTPGNPGPPAKSPSAMAAASGVLDDAVAEYHRLVEMGQTPDLAEFSNRYSPFADAVYRMLLVETYLDDNPSFFGEESLLDWPLEGETFLGYTLVEELGRGGLARVFLAKEQALADRLVVVKISTHGEGEAQTLGRLDHPNVVPVHTVKSDPHSNLTLVCMPFLGTTTLQQLVAVRAAAPVPPLNAALILQMANPVQGAPCGPGRPQAAPLILRDGSYLEGICYLGVQIVESLDHIHHLGIVHRDLKPANVLLCPNGRPVLLDFNLSADNHRGETCLGGTFPYMAPELLRATEVPAPADVTVDARADLYSLGVILYELLSGRHPFQPLPPSAPEAAQRQHLQERQAQAIPLLDEIRPMRPRLAALVHQLLESNPEDRPQSAAEVGRRLQEELSPCHRSHMELKWLRRTAAALVLLALGACATVSGAWVLRAVGPTLATRVETELVQGHPSEALTLIADARPIEAERPGVHFLRGRAHQMNGDMVAALRAYEAVDPERTNGRIQACRAYCLAHLEKNFEAIEASKAAVAAGYAPTEVSLNLAYCQIRVRRFGQASQTLSQAVTDGSHARAAVAFLRFLATARRNTRIEEGPPPAQTLAELDAALQLAPGPSEVLREAALYCCRGERHLDRWRERAMGYLEQMNDLGADFGSVRSMPLLQKLTELPRFHTLMNTTVRIRNPLKDTLLVDPLRQDSEVARRF